MRRLLSTLLVLPFALSACAATPEDDAEQSEDAVTNVGGGAEEDMGHGWTKQTVGASRSLETKCVMAEGESPCGTRFRAHVVAGEDRNVSVERGNSGKYYLSLQSQSAWLRFYNTLVDDKVADGENGRSNFVGSEFSIKNADHYFDRDGQKCVHFGLTIGIDITNKGFPARHGFSTDVCEKDMGKRIRYRMTSAPEDTWVTIDWRR